MTGAEVSSSVLARLRGNRKPAFVKRVVMDTIWYAGNYFGSRFFSKAPPGDVRLLNLGSGRENYPGFVNADCFDLLGLFQRRKTYPDWMLDATRPWRCANDYWDGIFCEHMLEHLVYADGIFCLAEAYRTLKPGGTIRIIVPDLDRYVQFCRHERVPVTAFGSAPEAIANLTQEWGHVSVWNAALLVDVLREVGFTDAHEVEFGVGSLPAIVKDAAFRAWESFYVEARKA